MVLIFQKPPLPGKIIVTFQSIPLLGCSQASWCLQAKSLTCPSRVKPMLGE